MATTTGAFFANLVSRLMPVSQFGVFAGTAISVNFFLVSTYFASVLVLHERYFLGERPCRCRRRYDPDHERHAPSEQQQQERKMDKWYLDVVAAVLTQHARKFVVVCFLLGLGGAGAASQIKQASETPLFLPEDHPVQMMLSRLQCDDPDQGLCYSQETTTDERQVYVMMWGVESEVDRQGTSRFDDLSASCDFEACGQHTLDGTFDLREEAAQRHVRDTCERGAKELAWVNLETIESCIMMDFERWLVQRNRTFPAPKAEFMGLMAEFLEGPVEKATFVDGRKIKIHDGRVEWVSVEWQSQYQVGQFYAAQYVKPGFEEWQQFEVDTNARGPPSANKAFGTTSAKSGVFMMYETSNEFSASVFRCGAISASVAFVVLIAATQNLYVALIAKVNIITITASTVGGMYLYGWEMGVLESVCVVLVFGFAVDYTVHFCISYTERRPEDDGKYGLGSTRVDRVKHAFFELGASVLGGGITSFLAASVLFFCTAQFFKIFGIFICTVVVLSELYAHMFFMPLLAIIGPEGTQGDLGRKQVQAPVANGAEHGQANGAQHEPKEGEPVAV